MKLETRYKKALEEKNPNVRLAKMESICFLAMPHSEIWEAAKQKATELRMAGATTWKSRTKA